MTDKTEQPTIKITGSRADGYVLTIYGMTKYGPDEIEIFPFKDGCHILFNLSNDLQLLDQ